MGRVLRGVLLAAGSGLLLLSAVSQGRPGAAASGPAGESPRWPLSLFLARFPQPLNQFLYAQLEDSAPADAVAVIKGRLTLEQGRGRGIFVPFAGQPQYPSSVSAIVAARFTGHARSDLLVVAKNTRKSPPAILLMTNEGNARFSPPSLVFTTIEPDLGRKCRLAAGHFLPERNPNAEDFALWCESDPDAVYVGANNGAGAFGPFFRIVSLATGTPPVVDLKAGPARPDGTQEILLCVQGPAPETRVTTRLSDQHHHWVVAAAKP